MSMMRAQFQRQLFPGLYDIILDAWREQEMQFSKYFRVDKSDAAFEETLSVAGMGLFVRTPEGMEVSQDRFFNGFPKRYQHDDYTLAIGFTHQFLRDIKTRLARERSGDMGRSSRSSVEELNVAILNSGFDSNFPGPDGVELFSAVHPNIRGGTQSNMVTPTSTLSVTSFRLALTKFRRFLDDTGVRRIQLDPAWLVVPPELEFQAKEIVKSMGRPDTANRADNVTRGAAEVGLYTYLSDTNNWFVLADKNQHYLQIFQRETFNVKEFEEEKLEIIWVRGRFSQSFGWSHWMGTVGSNPA
jgi:hypothetical protein